MRPRGATAGSAFADGLTLLDGGSLLYQELREMHIQGEDGFAVIDHDQTAFEVHFANDGGAARVGGFDPSAHRGRVVETLMSTLCSAVIDAAHAEGRGVTRIDGCDEGTFPKTVGRRGFEDRMLDRDFLVDSGLNLFGRLYELRRNCDCGGRIAAGLHGDFHGLF